MVYPDLTIVISLLVPGENTGETNNLLRVSEVPLTLTIVHRLQVENSLLRFLHSSDSQIRAMARNGLLLWRQYIEEGVFELRSFPLAEAFAQTTAWNAESTHQPPRWHLWIHVAMAAAQEASFMSLDPALRRKAANAGLSLIPERL